VEVEGKMDIRQAKPLMAICTTSFVHPGWALTRTPAHPTKVLTNLSSPWAHGNPTIALTSAPCTSGFNNETCADIALSSGSSVASAGEGLVGVGKKCANKSL
jgi:hypothetical protein